tara:strand:+ start:10321 stop:10983 length:663 start_codon:yes stop_codon:yes gene_type:complete
MKVLAIIPSRKGSKRIPKKNIKHFLGKPMIEWPIRALKKLQIISDIYISTDCNDAENIAKSLSCNVHKRDKTLCGDHVTSIEVIESFARDINYQFDFLVMVYPTTPKLDTEKLLFALEELSNSEEHHVALSIAKFCHPVERSFKLISGEIIFNKNFKNTRTQDIEPTYHDAANFYVFKKTFFSREMELFSKSTLAIEISRLNAIDIDNKEDWASAEKLAK